MLNYSFEEALSSLVRGGRAAAMSMGTIATAFLALGGFLLVTGNLQRVVRQWTESAEVSVFLRDDVSEATRTTLQTSLHDRPGVVEVAYLSKEEALERFRADFPELADVSTSLGTNPFPASLEVRLQPGPGVADEAAALASAVSGLDGVADVQFDRQWLERLLSLIAGIRVAGIAVTIVLLLGAAFTVTAVVRLSLHARRAEIDIMQLVGAPIEFIRGPFVLEGTLLGGIGALIAILLLAAGFSATRSSLGAGLASVAGSGVVRFLTIGDMLLLVGAGLSVGALAGLVASRSAR